MIFIKLSLYSLSLSFLKVSSLASGRQSASLVGQMRTRAPRAPNAHAPTSLATSSRPLSEGPVPVAFHCRSTTEPPPCHHHQCHFHSTTPTFAPTLQPKCNFRVRHAFSEFFFFPRAKVRLRDRTWERVWLR